MDTESATGSDDGDDPDLRQLHRIAEIVGFPSHAFFTGHTGLARIDDTRELLRLWSMIGTDEGRRHVLQAARDVIGPG